MLEVSVPGDVVAASDFSDFARFGTRIPVRFSRGPLLGKGQATGFGAKGKCAEVEVQDEDNGKVGSRVLPLGARQMGHCGSYAAGFTKAHPPGTSDERARCGIGASHDEWKLKGDRPADMTSAVLVAETEQSVPTTRATHRASRGGGRDLWAISFTVFCVHLYVGPEPER